MCSYIHVYSVQVDGILSSEARGVDSKSGALGEGIRGRAPADQRFFCTSRSPGGYQL